MLSMAIPSQVCTRESIDRNPWTSAARNDVSLFIAKSFGLVCAAMFLYSLGPALAMALIVVSLAVWSLLRNQIASEEEEGPEENSGYAATLNSSAHCANPVWVRSDRFGMPAAADTRPVQRQGA
ncbi:MAG: hypothetical protein ACLP9L_04980 [Thermoguttaceae bacterium]